MNVRFHFLMLMTLLFSGCGSARFHSDQPALPFEAVDYTFAMTSGTVNGVHLAWHDSGGDGPVVVLVHGLASNAGFWRANLHALADAGMRVIAVDLPGYGKSGKSFATPYGMAFYARTIDALLERLGIARATVAGHSMGGQIAMTMVLAGSTRVTRLILLSPAGIERFGDGEGRWMKGAMTPAFVMETPEDRVRANLAANFFEWRDDLEWMVEERVRMAKDPAFERFAYAVSRCVAAMIDEPVWQRLAEIRLPVLILAGENDNLIPNPYLHGGRTRGVMEEGLAQIPSARLEMIPDAGHMIQLERPDAVNAVMISFLRDR